MASDRDVGGMNRAEIPDISEEEYEMVWTAFTNGRFVDVTQEHEGATQTFIYEVPEGHVGISLCISPGDGDLSVSVGKWQKEKHHELDRWIWVRPRGEA